MNTVFPNLQPKTGYILEEVANLHGLSLPQTKVELEKGIRDGSIKIYKVLRDLEMYYIE